MTIPFVNTPSAIRVPLFYAEIDPSHANTATEVQRTLIIGQVLTGSTLAGAPNVPVLGLGPADAIARAGAGSQLALMVAAYAQNDPEGEIWYLPVADPAGAAATGSVAIGGPATATGVINLYVAGQLVQLTVTSGQTAAQIATNLGAAINAISSLPVTATVATSTVTVTCKHLGDIGNDIDIRLNYRGAAAGEQPVAGFMGAVTITPMSGGTLEPDLATGLANLVDQPFDFIVLPFNGATQVGELTSFLSDVAGRWSPTSQIYGHVFRALRGTAGALQTAGALLNDQHQTLVGFYDSPTPNWLWAAAIAGAAAPSLRNDPGQPVQTLAVAGVLAPPLSSRFSLSIRNTLLYTGISTFTVDSAGVVRLENLITTYQKNGGGAPDNSYLEIETMFLLMYVLRFLRIRVQTVFARCKLAANGTRFAPGSNIVTPNIIRVDQIAVYRDLEFQGYVQRSDLFAQNIIVQQNAQNPNRVDVLWPGILIDQLRIFALLCQFRLS